MPVQSEGIQTFNDLYYSGVTLNRKEPSLSSGTTAALFGLIPLGYKDSKVI